MSAECAGLRWPHESGWLSCNTPLQKDAPVRLANLGRLGLAAVLQREVGVSQRAALRLVDDIRDHMSAALLNGEKVVISGFGTFFVKRREGHVARNPQTKERVMVPPHRVVMFRPSEYLDGRLNGRLEPGRRPYQRQPRSRVSQA